MEHAAISGLEFPNTYFKGLTEFETVYVALSVISYASTF